MDAAGPLADLLQPGNLRLVPLATPADVLGGRVLPGNRPGRTGLATRRGALSPWVMGLPFGAGQLLAAAVLTSH